MDVESFDEIAADFDARVRRIVWCTATTVDRRGRPRARLLHPVWEGSRGWILTGRQSLKAKHLERNPYISLSYWDPQHQQVYAECKTRWIDDPSEREAIWRKVENEEEPYGYNPALIWPSGPRDESFGVLELDPWRIEVSSLEDMMSQKPPRVWRQDV